jgi:putative nucleotidyltransferase with HDIG domain
MSLRPKEASPPLPANTGGRGRRRRLAAAGLLLLLLVLSALVAWLANPMLGGQQMPLADEDVGKVISSDIRAPISFTVPDEEATERKRREAEEGVRSVYDFESELGQQRAARVGEAFRLMAGVMQQKGASDAGEGARPAGKSSRGSGEEAAQDSLKEEVFQKRSEFMRLMQVAVPEEDFEILLKDGFSDRARDAIALLVERTLQHMVISSRELLNADRQLGIVVRRLRSGLSVGEEVLYSFDKILDLDDARMRLQQTAAMELTDLPKDLRRVTSRLAGYLVSPNLVFNREETEARRRAARAAVGPLEIRIQKGAMIIRDGDVIEARHIKIFREIARLTRETQAFGRLFGTALLVAAWVLVVLLFSRQGMSRQVFQTRQLLFLSTVLMLLVLTVKVGHWVFSAVWERFQLFPLESLELSIPYAAGAMLVRFVLSYEAALLFTLVTSPICGLLMPAGLSGALFCLAGSLLAIWSVGSARQRAALFRAGAVTGAVNAVFGLLMAIMAGPGLEARFFYDPLFAFLGGIFSAMVVMSSAPLAEAVFGYTTDVKLMELANLNHPLLKDLIVQAPGSYHHSIIVGSLVEAAAEAIGCNPLLARVMAYYHDIGKTRNPQYFSENQRDGNNPHDRLKASLSATILKAHVRDGAELARINRLGRPIVDAIVQHHGRSLIKFFYQKAQEQDPAGPINEEDFRYPGPKPQTREVALVMLADCVEAAARSVGDPTPARLQGLVQNMINRLFADGQLDECSLTLQDLHEIARSFILVLNGIYHRRPDYPQAAVKERPVGEKRKATEGKRRPPAEFEENGNGEDLKRLGL